MRLLFMGEIVNEAGKTERRYRADWWRHRGIGCLGHALEDRSFL
jgi:hypothetical protein